MAFKLRSPLHTGNPYRAKSKAIVTAHAKAVADYKPGSKANPTYGTAENIKEADLKVKGKRTNLPLEKPKVTKAKSNLPASQGGSPFYGIGQAAAQRDKSNAQEGKGTYKFENNNKSKTNLRLPRFSVSKYMEAPAGTKFAAATSGDNSMPKTSGPKELRPGGGVRRSTITSEGYKIPGTSDNKRPEYKTPGTGSSTVKPKNTVKPSSNTNTSTSTTKSSNTTTTLSTGSNTNADKSGGYLKNTKNFSLGVDTNMGGNISKVQNVVSKARDAGHNLISGGAMSKRDRIRNRQGIRTENKRTRVGQQIERIKGRQQRAGISKDKGTNPGYSTEQKKLDAFEKSMDSPKAAKPSMKLKPTMSKTQTLTDSQLNKKLNKPAVKKKTTGKTKSLSMTRGEKQTSLTDLAMTGKK